MWMLVIMLLLGFTLFVADLGCWLNYILTLILCSSFISVTTLTMILFTIVSNADLKVDETYEVNLE